MEKPTRIGQAAKALAVVVVVAAVAYPLLGVIGTSFASQSDIIRSSGLVLWPDHPTTDAYRTIFTGGVVTRALVVSLGITVFGTLASLLVTVGMAYGLSRRDVTGSRFILMTALFTMLFNAGIIPNFLLVKGLGLYDTYAALVMPTLVSAFNLVVLRSFFMNLPEELYDAAKVDGAGDFRILVRIVLPLSKAVLAVISLFYAVTYWNAFFNSLLYLNDSDKWPLPMVLRTYVLQGQSLNAASAGEVLAPQQAVQMAVLVIAVVPILCVYPFLQRYFTKGVLTGAIKG
ncbi:MULTISPECIES: carbohydrate ABC transporter permease [Streptomyces]|jgi:putative aldouronate transport system permease protein|uniref:carbohydrate ABC transporter permease n=1 Tax=unclassified Streptomyces TaxID=2593676 RepID=UPI00088A1E56|nr:MULTISPECIES: carbohydrate ABC transporter permease [unclassified Streptomyces]MDX2731365.1 carbohydrate ABC transporter permease [Streptomyces sp. PA03-2a]MDX3768661.1 carbohydrate ABC transporter permease [Streptomyces sp. AK08-01B]MDX3818595.1 carbohydrate ABC transporter permease [Streptomyces sp. AK08-01A]WSQ32178.1 carbohydrate ABC transporter permease [Streptomyces sp. NBC_01230]SCX85185.1 carbohydrate ABC transporter membrane protein 2, CUT1 family [Streptomyces sp. 136MFCol5.1]